VSRRFSKQEAARVLAGDSSFVLEAIERGVVECDDDTLVAVQVERIRVARTLVRDLEVNWAGVEIILRMRDELLATRSQMSEVLARVVGGASLAEPADGGPSGTPEDSQKNLDEDEDQE